MNKQKKAFTLVELIVSITILAILGTISFISMQGYSKNSRDSVRLSDLSSIKTSLELFYLNSGKYPLPTGGYNITYSGSQIWTQGTIGNNTIININKLDKIPLDPLTFKEYTYSITQTNQQYQLAGMSEGSQLSQLLLSSQVQAGNIVATAIVTGNYNGKILKTNSGVNCEILTVPSIISSLPNSVTNLEDILTNTGLVYDGFNNLPNNYLSSKYKVDGGFNFISNKLVAYSDSLECKPLYDAENDTARDELIENIQIAYSGTIIENKDGIIDIINLDLSNTGAKDIIGTTLVNNDLGGDLDIPSNNDLTLIDGGDGELSPISCLDLTQTQIDILNGMEYLGVDSESNIYNSGINLTKEQWCSLTSLEIYNSSHIPDGVGYLNNLGFLYIGNGTFSSFPPTISNLTNLTDLYIVDSDNIPEEIGLFKNLTYLYIEGGSFNSLPSTIGDLTTLEEIDVYDNNYINSIPSEIGNLTNLKSIYFKANQNLTSIPSEIGNLYNLENLYLDDNNLIVLPSNLSNLTNLSYLILENNPGLGELSYNFNRYSNQRSQTNITIEGYGLAIGSDSDIQKIVITLLTPDPTYTIADCDSSGNILKSTTKNPSCNNNDIIVCSGLSSGYIISACNAGTLIAGTDTTSYGGIYQWGNNFDFRYGQYDSGEFYPIVSNTRISTISENSTYSNSTYIKGVENWTNDSVNDIDNLWGNSTNTNEARKGPCEEGYHIPTNTEWINLINAGGWTSGYDLQNDLKLPFATSRTRNDSQTYRPEVGNGGRYYSSTPNNSGDAYYLEFYSSYGILTNIYVSRTRGFSIRCFKN